MKVVLFCGGLGMRLRDYAENVPKPMVPLDYRPILWHLMKYYAHFGHTDFILCLGYRGDLIKRYFLIDEECTSCEVVLSESGRRRETLNGDTAGWRITFAETGLDANIGERLMAVRRHLAGEEMFLANYSDGLTDLHLPDQIEHLRARDSVASFLAVKPNLSYHFLNATDDGVVTSFRDIAHSGLRVNGGFFVFRQEIFDYMRAGEELVERPFQRLMDEGRLLAYRHDGFWVPMDTAKDKQRLDALVESGNPPWYIWRDATPRSRIAGGGRREQAATSDTATRAAASL
jgi:glucose-1-phosphate cytidylyltransferase